jgi:hypothetical protein
MADGYEVKWLVENEVVWMIQKHDLPIAELVEMIEAVNNLMITSSHEKVPVIVDGSMMKNTTGNISEIIKKFRTVRSDKWGFTVVIGAQGVIKFFVQLVLQLARVEVRMAKDMDEAIGILRHVYPDLPTISIK